MAHPAPRIHYSPALQEALAWLGAPPAADGLHDLAPMRKHLANIADIGIPPLQHVKILELFETRAKLASDAVKPLLLDTTLPVPKRLRVVAQGLMQVHRTIAVGYLKAVREAPVEKFKGRVRTPAHVCARGLANLQQEYEIAQFVSATPPTDFWAHAESLYRLAIDRSRNAPNASATEAEDRMKALLAMAAGQPEGFSPREVAFLSAYLQRHAAAVEIRDQGVATDDGDYWVDAVHGFAPTATVRRRTTAAAALHFSCLKMSRLARAHLERLLDGERPESLGLPHDLVSADYRDVLIRAAAHWESPRTRQTNRRRHGSRVQVCTQLGRLWQSHQDGGAADMELAQSEWMVLNESASGYAIMHVAGTLAGLMAGGAIGLRPAPDKPWNICIVRWARSDNPEHIELGLEVVAPQADAVRIARAGHGGEAAALPALLLPPLAVVGRGEALLTARGCFVPGPFTLLSESSGRLKLSECTASHLQMHTACIEIFEFDRLRVPG